MITVKLSSGFKLEFDTLAQVLAHSPHWILYDEDEGEPLYVHNVSTGKDVGIVLFDDEIVGA